MFSSKRFPLFGSVRRQSITNTLPSLTECWQLHAWRLASLCSSAELTVEAEPKSERDIEKVILLQNFTSCPILRVSRLYPLQLSSLCLTIVWPLSYNCLAFVLQLSGVTCYSVYNLSTTCLQPVYNLSTTCLQPV